ncbi:RNA 2',3'-cyclic phosphodiesterase [Oceanobacillus timonensis]|uniref:RNA 2',3'-cyclic phosphodiesterase n=1 Tax=Oceanobacillus timonensis TaxID=1926285 RepID=UPI0015C4CDD4|nr:RNA 2',3'-cyclic phosphodiesterase [Oceanobacillus timonensis]
MSHYFIGIPVQPELAKQLAAWQTILKKYLPYKQWTHRYDFHITLVFLGEVDEQSIEMLQRKLSSITACPSFALKRTELKTFGNKKQPRVIWLGMEHHPLLHDMQEQVVQICETIGYKREKRGYTPHITIAKKWADQRKELSEHCWNDILADMSALDESFDVDAIQLYKVHPASNPKYEVVQRFPLREKE